MSSIVIWRPEALNAKLLAAVRPAAVEVGRAAALKSPSKRVAASIDVVGAGTEYRVIANHPLGILFEKGTGPHEITPKKKALKLADGSFVSGPVQHPGMPAKPFLRPSLALWPGLYRRNASVALRGF